MDEPPAQETMPRMSLAEHLEELRRRMILALAGLGVGMLVGLGAGRWIIEQIKHPYVAAMIKAGQQPDLAVLTATGGLVAYLKVSLLAGAILAAPWMAYQFWQFVATGLYPHERRYVQLAVPFSAGLFIAGAMFFLLVAARPALYYLISVSLWLGLRPIITLQSHISFMVSLALVMGLGFQTPLVILLLAKLGLVSAGTLNHYRRHVIVAILILAAVLTPPDVFTQLAMAIPMYVLFEMSVLLVRLFVRPSSGGADRTDKKT